MNPPNSNSTLVARFFSVGTERAEGPFDLVELAGQLRQATLHADSLLCREGEETWVAFRNLPEFVEVQKIANAVETASRPPEPKAESVERPSSSPSKGRPLPLIATASALGLLGTVVLTFVFHPALSAAPSPPPPPVLPQAPPTPVQASWPTTQDERFFVQCPVLLEKANGPEAGDYHYAGKIPGVVFSVVYVGPAHVHMKGTQTMNAVRDKWLRLNHGKITSEYRINSHGHEGREVVVTMPGRTDTTEAGRIRFFVTDHGTFEVFVGAEPGKFSDDEMNRFLASFEIR